MTEAGLRWTPADPILVVRDLSVTFPDFFGNIPFVEKNLEVLVLGIIGFSLLPAVYHAIVNRRKAASTQ